MRVPSTPARDFSDTPDKWRYQLAQQARYAFGHWKRVCLVRRERFKNSVQSQVAGCCQATFILRCIHCYMIRVPHNAFQRYALAFAFAQLQLTNTLCKRWNWKANTVLWCVKGQKCGVKEKTISRAASYTRNFVSHGASSLPMLAGSRGMMLCRVPLLCRITNRKKLSMTSAQYIADALLHRYG
jgi:hypothetical protein